MKTRKMTLLASFIMSTQFLFGVPQLIEQQYNQICWQCYSPEISVQNFLNRHRETLRNLCFKKDAKACHMMATLYAALLNDFDAQAYWQRSCKLGNKDDCAKVTEDEE